MLPSVSCGTFLKHQITVNGAVFPFIQKIGYILFFFSTSSHVEIQNYNRILFISFYIHQAASDTVVYIWSFLLNPGNIFPSVLQLEKLVSKESLHYDIICFHYYIQYHLHLQVSWVEPYPIISNSCVAKFLNKMDLIAYFIAIWQLSEAAEYARKNGVVLKGDLPIGVDRNSVDTWVYPNLFRMNTSTGAPPDYFDKNGQNWGFPTYNWEEMSKDNYAWWRARLTQVFVLKSHLLTMK